MMMNLSTVISSGSQYVVCIYICMYVGTYEIMLQEMEQLRLAPTLLRLLQVHITGPHSRCEHLLKKQRQSTELLKDDRG